MVHLPWEWAVCNQWSNVRAIILSAIYNMTNDKTKLYNVTLQYSLF